MPSTHHILRETIDINYFGAGERFAIRQNVENLCAAKLTNAIGELLDAWELADDQVVSLDRIEIDVTGITTANIEGELIRQTVTALRRKLESVIGKPRQPTERYTNSRQQSVLAQIQFFLARGYLPWSATGSAEWVALAEQALLSLRESEYAAILRLLDSTSSRQRFVRHFPQALVQRILPILWTHLSARLALRDLEMIFHEADGWSCAGKVKENLQQITIDEICKFPQITAAEIGEIWIRVITRFRPVFNPSVLFWQSPEIQWMVDSRKSLLPPADEVVPLTSELSENLLAQKASETKSTAKKNEVFRRPSADTDFIYIKNGGLVILAPYLGTFFRRLGIANDKQILDVPIAIALLRYLVFGQGEYGEWELVLEKLFCGLALVESVPMNVTLSHAQIAEADELLGAVIANWPALKNTSPDGLREAFLKREGSLQLKDHHWQMRLARKTQDVLVDRLGWTISMVRLPWMPVPLHTDWADASA